MYRVKKDDRNLYYIEKRFLWFFWSYNTGYFATEKLAYDCIQAKLYCKYIVIK